ncbi:MAG: hypothetical protein EA422_00745 [Gemmatimonadales bacterium]|nr:MAG: hypothetical protein EA422_00745 [Gemmatimonadales bacterium]
MARRPSPSPLRALDRPVPVQVRSDPDTGVPHLVMDRGAARRVAQVMESWRIDDEWWRVPISRRYHRVVLEGGRPMTLFQDLVERKWYRQ